MRNRDVSIIRKRVVKKRCPAVKTSDSRVAIAVALESVYPKVISLTRRHARHITRTAIIVHDLVRGVATIPTVEATGTVVGFGIHSHRIARSAIHRIP